MASIRARKKQVASHLFMCMLGRQLENWLNNPDADEQKMLDDNHKARWVPLIEGFKETSEGQARWRANMEALLEPNVEEAKVEYIVEKINGGTVVDTFDTREAALALVLKHARQKKAKVQVRNSGTGELVLFSEEEMAA